eukprot:155771-Lingulodinium_polyedra.AAC.1
MFYSSPCTGGSPRQRMNVARAARNGCSQFTLRMSQHLSLHKRLWRNFVMVVEKCAKVGAAVFIEWP